VSLELRDIHKHFGAVRANDGISLSLADGELHGLLGENGAGKSTLMRVLSGFLSPDSGEVLVDGDVVGLRSPADALDAGIGMLHQDPLVLLPFSVLDNFLMGLGGSLRLNRRAGRKALAEASERYGFHFDPDAEARSLTVGERQQLEIVRLLWRGARTLILDEPTTGISESQRQRLFEVLRSLAGEGMIVIFVSHKLEEIEDLCHSVTVMRSGQVVGGATLPTPRQELIEMIFGVAADVGGRVPTLAAGPSLSVSDLSLPGFGAAEVVNLEVAEGEVLGLAGLEGSGQRAFLDVCAGLTSPTNGRLELGGKVLPAGRLRKFQRAGVHFLPAGRLEEGLVEGLTITEHFELVRPNPSKFIDWPASERLAGEGIDSFTIKGVPGSTAESLSGGNQQRLLLAMMPESIRLLLMEHPTRGLDIESAEFVWQKLLARREQGTSIIFASADLEELLRYCDRIAVFFNGEIIGLVDAAGSDQTELGLLMGGVAAGEAMEGAS
jgi:simple sugar transport system ATP-binding protein